MNSDLQFLREWTGDAAVCVVRGEQPHREHGFLFGRSPIVNLGYVWDGGTGKELEYESFAAMLADGWKVD